MCVCVRQRGSSGSALLGKSAGRRKLSVSLLLTQWKQRIPRLQEHLSKVSTTEEKSLQRNKYLFSLNSNRHYKKNTIISSGAFFFTHRGVCNYVIIHI